MRTNRLVKVLQIDVFMSARNLATMSASMSLSYDIRFKSLHITYIVLPRLYKVVRQYVLLYNGTFEMNYIPLM